MNPEPAWQLVLAAARQLSAHQADFSRAALIGEVRSVDSSRRLDSLGPVIQGMTRGATGGPPSPCGTPLIRLSHGRYTLIPTPAAADPPEPDKSQPPPAGSIADVALIGCVKTKADHPSKARDLYRSPLFLRRQAHVRQSARRYYILSAEHGLVSPDTTLDPYDTALAEQSAEYRRAWGQWVLAKLLRIEGSLHDKVIEVHAGDEYVQAIAGPLRLAGAILRRPLEGLSFGKQLAWYGRQSVTIPARPAAPVVPATSASIVATLLRYGRDHQAERAGTPPQFTPNQEANTLILTDPFAFLLAVLFDQGIPAERAWRAPHDLRQRIGHLNPVRIAAEPQTVRAAIAQPPALHRYVNNMPLWLVAAAERVIGRYDGDASRIWAGEPTATDLAARLRTFLGIGQKKAAMAVEILARDLNVPIRNLSGSDIAYDVHVRRVFLRTSLADTDDLDHMVEVARSLHPERPGELDFPAWLIGRRWCSPGTPACPTCPLTAICPKDLGRASRVN